VRKWTKSACVVVALGIGLLLAVVGFTAATGSGGSAHAAQAKTSIASSSSTQVVSSTQAALAGVPASLMTVVAAPVATKIPVSWVVRPGDTLSGIAAALGVRGGWQALYAANRRVVGPDPNVIYQGTTLTVPGKEAPLRYAIAPGDTLSAIAAALGVRGGWQALYAANRRVVGPDPGLIRPGTLLTVPPPAAGKSPALTGTGPGGHRAPSSPAGRSGQPSLHGPAAGGTPTVSGSASPAGLVPVGGTGADGVMPGWLKATLVVVGALTVASFITQPAVAAGRRRRQAIRVRAVAGKRDRGRRAAERAGRIVQADHERLIITYSVSDDTVYLLTPPGEDPRAVLRAARLVLPEDTYEELADHLGVPSGWQRE
jgi:LysM repeat protein